MARARLLVRILPLSLPFFHPLGLLRKVAVRQVSCGTGNCHFANADQARCRESDCTHAKNGQAWVFARCTLERLGSVSQTNLELPFHRAIVFLLRSALRSALGSTLGPALSAAQRSLLQALLQAALEWESGQSGLALLGLLRQLLGLLHLLLRPLRPLLFDLRPLLFDLCPLLRPLLRLFLRLLLGLLLGSRICLTLLRGSSSLRCTRCISGGAHGKPLIELVLPGNPLAKQRVQLEHAGQGQA